MAQRDQREDARREGQADPQLHRALMAQEDGLRASADHPDAVDGALALARELHALGELIAEPDESPAPQRWGRLKILRPLGRGGLSEVYLALDERLGRRVAVKRLRPHAALDDRRRSWLVREGQSLARIQHPGVVGVLDLDTSRDDPLLLMEYVEGAPLSAVLAHLGGAPSDDPHVRAAATVLEPVAARVDLARRIAAALAHCHAEGVLHRDIKPSNVVVDLDFQPRLIDFGLAHLDDASDGAAQSHLTEQLVGTPAYFAPEQIDATRIGVDPRSDQFAFGALLYELLSGVQPFARASRQATMQAIANADFAPLRTAAPHVAPELEWIVQRCLERDARERYPDMAALARDLDAFLSYRAVSVAPPSLLKQLGRSARRNAAKLAWAGAAIALAALASGARYAHEARAASRERHQVVAQTRAALGAFSQPDDFQSALYRLFDVTNDERAEAGPLRALLTESIRETVERTLAALTDALLAQVSLERDEGRLGLREFQLSRWRGALTALARARPNDERVREQIARERVWGPAEESLEQRLERWIPGGRGKSPRLAPAPWVSDPGLGRYRWSAVDRATGALVAERDFTLCNDGEPLRLQVEPQVEWRWDSRSIAIESAESLASTGARRVRLGERLITWSDFEQVFRESASDPPGSSWRMMRTAHRGREPQRADPHAVAVVSCFDAEHFAARVGARLPSLAELSAALEQNAISTPDSPVEYEWLCEPGESPGFASVFKHRPPNVGRGQYLNDARFGGRASDGCIAFRLARSEH